IRKTKKKEGGARRAQRASSNVFSNFEQTQIQEFKEAFTLIDQNRDGFIDKEDLKDIYASLGKTNVKDEELESMLKEAAGPINFTMFLNLFGAKLLGEFHTIYIRGGQTFCHRILTRSTSTDRRGAVWRAESQGTALHSSPTGVQLSLGLSAPHFQLGMGTAAWASLLSPRNWGQLPEQAQPSGSKELGAAGL
uniref:EF-hand domain-containing protein n=1 Tax=Chelonoidis abingdonii TaxID=106734 RepID=A0A8C0GZG4_CHEAB